MADDAVVLVLIGLDILSTFPARLTRQSGSASEDDRRPHTPAMAEPFMEFDLPADIHRLHAETTWNTAQNARTLIKYDDFRVVLIALAVEARMLEHNAEGRISIHVLSGHIQLRASGRTFNLRSGGLLALDHGVSHDVHALEESPFLLAIAPGRT